MHPEQADNVLLAASKKDRRQFEVKLGDFGMARVLSSCTASRSNSSDQSDCGGAVKSSQCDGMQRYQAVSCGADGCTHQGPHIHTTIHGTKSHMAPELLSSEGVTPAP